MFVNRIISIKQLHALRVELTLLRKLQENRLLQPTGDVTATGEAIITGELMATQDRLKYTKCSDNARWRDRRFV